MKLILNHLQNYLRRRSSTLSSIKKSVFISQSNDIFTNLGLEQWMFKNMDFTNQHVMMLWRNEPCVVIGRYQNPWLEANVSELGNTQIARRYSGGGTVYHDLGNLNITFFTSNAYYNRKRNLDVIATALNRKWGCEAEVSKRDDINIRSFKISGTAAKLTRGNSYHHCTLLVNVNKEMLKKALTQKNLEIETNATRSIPSPVLNLKDEIDINMNDLINVLSEEYLGIDDGFVFVDPLKYPGLLEIREELASWEWVFGKTPKFTSSVNVPILSGGNLKLSLVIDGGVIQDVSMQLPTGLSTLGNETKLWMEGIENVKGLKFSEVALYRLKTLMQENLCNITPNYI